MGGSAREDAELRECRQEKRKTCLHDFFYRRVFRGDKVVECTVLSRVDSTAGKVLSHRALNKTLTKLVKQERGCGAELARKSAELK